MKTNEKTVLSRPINYWMAVLDKINEGTIIPSSDMKKSMAALSQEMGYVDSYSTRNQNKLVEELLKIIPEDCYEKADDTPKGKEKIAYIVIFNNLRAAKEEMKKFFSTPKPAKKTPVKEEEVKPVKVEEKKPAPQKPRIKTQKTEEIVVTNTRLDKREINQIRSVWNILEYFYTNKKSTELVSILAKKCFVETDNFKVYPNTITKNILSTNQLLGSDIKAIQSGKDAPAIVIANVKESLFKVGTAAQKLGIRLPLHKYIGEKIKKDEHPLQHQSPELSTKEKKAAWIMAGILKENNGFYDRAKLLEVVTKDFKIDLTETSLKNILRQSEFSASTTTNQIGLRNWNGARDKYSPEHSIRIVHARISMTLEELQRYFPDSEVVSEITPSDNIFKIVYDESRKSSYTMTELVRSFRGTDCIIDKRAEINRLSNEVYDQVNDIILSQDHQLRFETL